MVLTNSLQDVALPIATILSLAIMLEYVRPVFSPPLRKCSRILDCLSCASHLHKRATDVVRIPPAYVIEYMDIPAVSLYVYFLTRHSISSHGIPMPLWVMSA